MALRRLGDVNGGDHDAAVVAVSQFTDEEFDTDKSLNQGQGNVRGVTALDAADGSVAWTWPDPEPDVLAGSVIVKYADRVLFGTDGPRSAGVGLVAPDDGAIEAGRDERTGARRAADDICGYGA